MFATYNDHLKLAPQQAEQLLSLSVQEFLSQSSVQALLKSLDVELLRQTLPTAGSVLARQLPPFYNWLKSELGVANVPDTPDHATKWVVNFLNNQESLARLVELHRPVPQPAMERAIPKLVAAFDDVENGTRQEWQKAVSALCLLLAVAARDRDLHSSNA
ncbi:hypothetical protein [Leptolyngbya sp. FACHB-261]|uniref:hypothetical protein n=1 Tax=Leptolyngbya sp. FACHB-261 TaxID=2692806 RepID=UPI001687CF64|nr:hypothetical protein [Leptolyngbya sp. FACHB-261]MBD2104225.1 hypothetical protein [Leptolyngbya sp. FACHB-261]